MPAQWLLLTPCLRFHNSGTTRRSARGSALTIGSGEEPPRWHPGPPAQERPCAHTCALQQPDWAVATQTPHRRTDPIGRLLYLLFLRTCLRCRFRSIPGSKLPWKLLRSCLCLCTCLLWAPPSRAPYLPSSPRRRIVAAPLRVCAGWEHLARRMNEQNFLCRTVDTHH